MELSERVESQYASLTRSGRKVGDLFLSDPDRFAFLSLDKISRQAGVSTTTTLRFCRTLGFEGYTDFQGAVRRELSYLSTLPEQLQNLQEEPSDGSLMDLVMERGIRNIRRTVAALSPETLSALIRLITDGRRLFVFGMREAYSLVHYAYTRLFTVRDNVFILDAGYNSIVEPVLSLNEEDVCLVFLFHRYTKLTLRLLPLLKEQGVKLILFTSEPFDEVASCADVLIPCQLDSGGIKNSYLAPVCLLDGICQVISLQAGNDLLLRMNRLEKILNETGAV